MADIGYPGYFFFTEAPDIGEAQRVGLAIFGISAVFGIVKVLADDLARPSQPLGDFFLCEALEIEFEGLTWGRLSCSS